MFLAVDAGNSNIVLGVFDGERWIYHWRIETEVFSERKDLNSDIVATLKSIEFKSVIVSSVVPAITDFLAKSVENTIGVEPLLLKSTMDTGIVLGTDNPSEVGTDLIANAVAGYNHYKEGCIIVDFGTATTILAVNKKGVLAGGAICAGLKTTIEALIGKAAQLGEFEIEVPYKAIGRSTEEAMQSGLLLGHIAMVEGLVEQIERESGLTQTIATGGFSTLIARHTDIFDKVDTRLTLNGLRIIMERQEGKNEK